MLGPHPSNMGGVASGEQTLLAVWDKSRYQLRHIATFVNGSKWLKLLVTIRAMFYCLVDLVVWRPHLVHIKFSSGASFYRKSLFVLLVRLSRTKLVLHCHAPDFDSFYERHGQRGRQYLRFTLNAADLLLVVAEQWRAYFESLDLDVPVLTLYNAIICPETLAPAASDAAPVVLMLGRLGQRKGTYDILEAIPAILAVCPETQFWLGGDGDVEKVREIISAEAWGKNVRLLGWVRGPEKDAVLSRATLFLLPSYQEGLPVAILEALSYGLPVVTTPVGGIPEAVADGDTGFLISPGDVEAITERVTRLLQNAELRQQMSLRARRRALEMFEAGAFIQRLYEIYDAVLAEQ
jgi:glycosyltransferase involved in cell wall biosynthesis